MNMKSQDQLYDEWGHIMRGPRDTLSERTRLQRAQRPETDSFAIPQARKRELWQWLDRARFRSMPDTHCWVVLEEEFAPYLRPGDYFRMGNYESSSMWDSECNRYLKNELGHDRHWFMRDGGLLVVRKNRDPVLPLPAKAKQGAALVNEGWQGPMAGAWRGAARLNQPRTPPTPPPPPPPPRETQAQSNTQPPPLPEQPSTQPIEPPREPSPSPTPEVAQPDGAEGFAIVPFDVQAS